MANHTFNSFVFVGISAAAMLMMSCAQSSSTAMSTENKHIDFGSSMVEPWRSINDGVMGGLSEGEIAWKDTVMLWSGQTSLENNGGFASIRGPWEHHDLRAMNRAIIRCRGNGGPFKMTLETSQRWWMPYAYTSFNPNDDWQDVVIDVEDFSWSQAQMGDLRNVAPSQELGDVLRIGLMKYDGTAQPFELEVASIHFISAAR